MLDEEKKVNELVLEKNLIVYVVVMHNATG